MEFYLIIFWALALCAILVQLRLTPQAMWTLLGCSYVLLVLFVGLRWETGNDWGSYYDYYEHLTSLKDNAVDFEIGFRLFSFGAKKLGLPFAGFNVVYAAIYIGLIFLSFKEDNYSVSGWLVLQFYAPFIFGLMGTTRQVMALAICMFSVRYVLSKDWRKFLLCICVACTFHISALVFAIAWPLARVRVTPRRAWLALGTVILLSLLDVGSVVVRVVGSYLHVADLDQKLVAVESITAEDFGYASGANPTILWIIPRVGFLLLFIFCLRWFTEEADQLHFKLYFVSFVLLSLLSGPVFILANRTAIYFNIFQIYLFATLTRRIKTPLFRQAYCVLLLVISLSRMYSGIFATYPRIFVPYKGVFINQEVRRDPGWFLPDKAR